MHVQVISYLSEEGISRVVEVDSLSARAKMPTKDFVRRFLLFLRQMRRFFRNCKFANLIQYNMQYQGCISCGILVSGIRARGVSSEHMENMEMFSYSPT